MIVCQHEPSEGANEKFTVIFEDDEIKLLEDVVDASEGKLNFEQALYRIITRGGA